MAFSIALGQFCPGSSLRVSIQGAKPASSRVSYSRSDQRPVLHDVSEEDLRQALRLEAEKRCAIREERP